MKEINEFIEMSKYAGERFDLTQAAGGNTSIKLENGEMIIKASGFLLSEVDKNTGYSRVNTEKVKEILFDDSIVKIQDKRKREKASSNMVREATINNVRPSIETLLHSILLKYTLHTHPISSILILIRDDWKKILNQIFKNDKVLLVEYYTPGIDLALEMLKGIKESDENFPKIIFLKNHGLIISSDSYSEIRKINEYVCEKTEEFLDLDLNKYKLTNKISSLINKNFGLNNITYLCQEKYINDNITNFLHLINSRPCCPDILVYCGNKICILKSFDDIQSIVYHKKNYNELPKLFFLNHSIYISAISLKKAREIEEVFKLHVFTLVNSDNNFNSLSIEELNYLGNWEAEKFRQNL